jgi:hypothetical protein
MSVNDCIEKITEALKGAMNESTDNYLHTEAELTVDAELGNELYVEDTRQKLSVSFEIEFEWRSWGLRAVELGLRSIEEFEIEIMSPTEDGEELVKTISVNLDPADVELEWITGDAYTVTDIQVNLNDKGEVTAASATCTYPAK